MTDIERLRELDKLIAQKEKELAEIKKRELNVEKELLKLRYDMRSFCVWFIEELGRP